MFPTHCTRRLRMSQMLLFVALLIITTPTALTAKAPRGFNKFGSKNQRQCAEAVVMYLKRVVTRRSDVLERESRALMELDEARRDLGREEKENDGQRKPDDGTKQRLKAAWSAFESASAAVKQFDKATMQMHGNLPLDCILEVNALRSQNLNLETLGGKMRNVVELVALHTRLYWEIVRGVYRFTVSQYEPYLQMHYDTVKYFAHLARNVQDQLQLHKKDRPFDDESNALLDMAKVGLMHAKVAVYSVLPWMTVFAVGVFTLLFAPFMLAGILLPQLVWRVLIQLFLLHHAYGLTVDGFMISIREYVDLLTNQNWPELQTRLTTAFLTLVSDGENGTFFNGLFGLWFIAAATFSLFLLMYLWAKLPVMLIAKWNGEHDEIPVSSGRKDRVRQSTDNSRNVSSTPKNGGSGVSPARGTIRSSTKVSNPARGSVGSGDSGGKNQRKDL